MEKHPRLENSASPLHGAKIALQEALWATGLWYRSVTMTETSSMPKS
nr:MAG TPA: hypothetical protein [Caudoviricetes sp.]